MKIAIVSPGKNFTAGYVKSLYLFMALAQKAKHEVDFVNDYSADLYTLRNLLAEAVVKRGRYDVMLWIDSDMSFDPQDAFTVLKRPAHLVSGLCLVDAVKSNAALFHDVDGEEVLSYPNGWRLEETGLVVKRGDLKGCLPVDMVGFGFLAIKKGVFESLIPPYFKSGAITSPKGRAYVASEDMGFTYRCSQAGFRVYVDTTAKIGHEKTTIFKVGAT